MQGLLRVINGVLLIFLVINAHDGGSEGVVTYRHGTCIGQ